MKKHMFYLLVILNIFLLVHHAAYADNAKAIAITLKVGGDVQMRKSNSDSTSKLALGTRLDDGDWIKTSKDAFAVLIFTDDKSLIKLREGTEVTIEGKRDEQSSIAKRISLEVGQLYAKVEQQRGTLQIATPTSVASVKGTEFWVIVFEDGSTEVVTIEGLVQLMNRFSGQIVDVREGQRGQSSPNGDVQSNDMPQDENTPEDPAPNVNNTGSIQIEIEDEQGQIKIIELEYRLDEGE